MKTQKQAAKKTERNQLGRFMGTKRKVIVLRKRKHGKYVVRTLQTEMTPVEHLKWSGKVVKAIHATTSEPPRQHITLKDWLGPIQSPEKYEKRRKKLLKELAVMMARSKK